MNSIFKIIYFLSKNIIPYITKFGSTIKFLISFFNEFPIKLASPPHRINISFDRTRDILILCGGDANLIGNSLKKEINNLIVEPNLVMYGMIFLNKK